MRSLPVRLGLENLSTPMRDDLLHDATLEERVAPLLAAAHAQDRSWLRRVLLDPEAIKAFGAVDSELFVRGEDGARAIAVASAGRSEGRTTVSVMMAVLAAALDPAKRVLLIDADGERGRVGEMLGLPREGGGLAEVFSGKVPVDEAVHVTALPNLSVVPQGRGGAHALAFAHRAFEAVLQQVRDRFDLVLVDTPSGSTNKSVVSIAKIAGHTLLVIRYSGPTREQVGSFHSELQRSGTQVIGCVMNRRRYVVPAFLYGHR